MKKITLILAMWTLICCLQACKQKSESATEEATEVTTEASEAVADMASAAACYELQPEEIVFDNKSANSYISNQKTKENYNTEAYDHIVENEFKEATKNPFCQPGK